MVDLPSEIRDDIDYGFGYMRDVSYQDRAHEYIEKNKVVRSYNDTAVHAEVLDIAKRAFAHGLAASGNELDADTRSELLELAAKCVRIAAK